MSKKPNSRKNKKHRPLHQKLNTSASIEWVEVDCRMELNAFCEQISKRLIENNRLVRDFTPDELLELTEGSYAKHLKNDDYCHLSWKWQVEILAEIIQEDGSSVHEMYAYDINTPMTFQELMGKYNGLTYDNGEQCFKGIVQMFLDDVDADVDCVEGRKYKRLPNLYATLKAKAPLRKHRNTFTKMINAVHDTLVEYSSDETKNNK